MSYEISKYETAICDSSLYKAQIYDIEKYDILKYSPEKKLALKTTDSCDKYDYIAAVACGAIGGLVDVFLVGTPGNSKLGNWTDKQVDEAVMRFAKKLGWNPSAKNSNNVRSAIGYLEKGTNKEDGFKGFRVNYDQRKPSDVGNKFVIAPSTHHMMSLGHSPDIIGLFFSILNQFTSTSTFIADGRLITIDTEHLELNGNNFIMKIICGITNWFGHIMSDVAGSSGSHSRGTGIVVPFYEMFGFCKFGKFKTKNGIKDLAELAQAAYVKGYDARFGMAMAIPVIITDITIKLIWSIRQHFQYEKPIFKCMPIEREHADLRVMLLFAQGTLCLFDTIDAGIESHGCALNFFLHMNLIAWYRLGSLAFKEICIRFKMLLHEQIEAPAFDVLTSELNNSEDENLSNQGYINMMNKVQTSKEIRTMIPLINK